MSNRQEVKGKHYWVRCTWDKEECYLPKSLLIQLNPVILDCSKIVFPKLYFGVILTHGNNLRFTVPVQSSHSISKSLMLTLRKQKTVFIASSDNCSLTLLKLFKPSTQDLSEQGWHFKRIMIKCLKMCCRNTHRYYWQFEYNSKVLPHKNQTRNSFM